MVVTLAPFSNSPLDLALGCVMTMCMLNPVVGSVGVLVCTEGCGIESSMSARHLHASTEGEDVRRVVRRLWATWSLSSIEIAKRCFLARARDSCSYRAGPDVGAPGNSSRSTEQAYLVQLPRRLSS